jgi:hypothetical protein
MVLQIIAMRSRFTDEYNMNNISLGEGERDRFRGVDQNPKYLEYLYRKFDKKCQLRWESLPLNHIWNFH